MADKALQGSKSLQNLFASLRPSTSRNESSDAPPSDPSFFPASPSRYPDPGHPQNLDPSSSNTPAPDSVPALSNPTAPPNDSARPSATELMHLLRQTAGSVNTTLQQTQQQSQTPPPSTGGRGVSATQQGYFPGQNLHGRGMSSSDLVANFMGKSTVSPSPSSATPTVMSESHNSGVHAHPHPQDYLLQLLNRNVSQSSRNSSPRLQRQSSQTTVSGTSPRPQPPLSFQPSETASPENRQESPDTVPRRSSPIRRFGSHDSKEPTPFEPDLPPSFVQTPAEKQNESSFTYANPFEHLVASSPLQKRSGNATPQKEAPTMPRLFSHEHSQRLSRQDSPVPQIFSSAHGSLNENGQDVLQSIEVSDPKTTNSGSNGDDTLMNIGAPTVDTETVAQALNDVGDQVNRQVEYALNLGEGKDDSDEDEQEELEAEIEEQLHDAAVNVKDELESHGNMRTLETLLPKEAAREVKELIDEAAEGNVDGQHESADDEKSSGKGDEDFEVPVYNFPMKPFVSIDLYQSEPASLQFRQSTITDIARLKKDFDQIDRTLATASNSYIVYAMPKPGGYRVIRQDDGLDRQVFKETKDHIFNVAISNAAHTADSSPPLETCIATAMSGKVYWTALRVSGKDNLPADNFEQHCLIFPPVPAHDDNTSGGQLKTRAKKSNRHPHLFAIGRGKAIQIVFPLHAQLSSFLRAGQVVDTVSYFKDRPLKINMGKAGKDFTFSEDDTVITTLDKAGRLRFWDVQDLVNESNGTASALAPIEIKSPVLTFSTSVANEKSWPTSVLFVDKIRSYLKGTAQRYVIVGMKQNHTLQLWDLGLGKAVQEINFPHTKESDPVCSIAYHPASGIVVIAHPTRNSIYFIHLSSPKYNLQGLSQATYIERLANKDPLLPKPDATAILSGMREYCFSPKGQIRSIDLLPVTSANAADKEDPGLFELYVMHSKGVTCLNIRKGDLGWTEDMRVISSRTADAEGLIVIKELREPVIPNVSETSSVNGEAISSGPGKSKKKITDPTISKPSEPTISLDPTAPIESALNGAAATAPEEKSEKRKKKKPAQTTADESVLPPAPIPPSANPAIGSTALSSTNSRQIKDSSKPSNKSRRNMSYSEQISLGVSPDFMEKEVEKIRTNVSEVVSSILKSELDVLGRQNHDNMVAIENAGTAKQEKVIELISKSLNENVEKSLSRIVTDAINKSVIPTLHNVTVTSIRKEIPDWLSKHLLATLPAQLKLAVPEAVSKAMMQEDVLKFLYEQVSARVTANVDRQFTNHVQHTILPRFHNEIIAAVTKKVIEMEKKIMNRDQDALKIQELTKLVQTLGATVNSMASSQHEFQARILETHHEILKGQPVLSNTQADAASGALTKPPEPPQPSPEQLEIDRINELMNSRDFEQATIQVSKFRLEEKYPAKCDSGFVHFVNLNSLTSILFAAIRTSWETAQISSSYPLLLL